MSEQTLTTVIVAVLAAIPPTLVAFAAMLSSIRNAKKADAIISKTDEIHTLANSQLSTVTATLAVANEKIAGLEKLMGALAAKT